MKKIYTRLQQTALIALLAMPAGNLFAQWVNISPTATNVELFDVKFVDANNGIAVGRDHGTKIGYIFKTANGGGVWTTYTQTLNFYRACAWANSTNGNTAGYTDAPGTNIIYGTTNTATSWSLNASPISATGMEHMQFVNNTIGYGVGYGTSFGASTGVFKTTDGGTTWSNTPQPAFTGVGGFEFTDPNTGYIATFTSAAVGKIVKTIDGGLTWNSCFSGSWMKDVSFISPSNGFGLMGLTTHTIMGTTNNGALWNTLGSPTSTGMTACQFVDANTGWVVGNGGAINRTINGGTTWTVDVSPTAQGLNEISYTPGWLYACGKQGTVIKMAYCAVPQPPADITPAANHTLCAGASASLSAQGQGTVNWYATNASTTILGSGANFVTPTLAAGTYTYFAEATSCSVSASRAPITVTVSVCTGLTNNSLALSNVKIYPNPTNGQLNIELGILNGNEAKVQITNLLGQTVLSETTNMPHSSYNIQHLQSGLYICKIELNGQSKTIRLIKE